MAQFDPIHIVSGEFIRRLLHELSKMATANSSKHYFFSYNPIRYARNNAKAKIHCSAIRAFEFPVVIPIGHFSFVYSIIKQKTHCRIQCAFLRLERRNYIRVISPNSPFRIVPIGISKPQFGFNHCPFVQ